MGDVSKIIAFRCFTLLFIALFFCVDHYRAAEGRFRFDSYTTDNGLPQNGVRGIVQTPDGYLWFTTFDGLVRFDGVKFTVFDKNNTPGIASNRFFSLYKDSDGRLIAGTEDGGVTVYSNGTFRTFTTDDGLPSNTILGFHVDEKGEFYIVTAKGSVYLRGDMIVPAEDGVLINNSISFFRVSENNWFYKDDNVVQITPDKRRVNYPIKINYFNDTFSGISVFEDSKGSLWLGDLTGVYILKDGGYRKLTEQDGWPAGTLLRPAAEDNEGGIWFTSGWANTKKVGVVRYFDGRFTALGEEAGLSNLTVHNLFKDREGTIWVATDKGINHLRRQLFTTYSIKDGLSYNEVYPLLQATSGDIYIGTTRGLDVYHEGKFGPVETKNAGANRVSVTALYEDTKQQLWVGSIGGLFIYQNGGMKQVLSGKTVWAIASDADGNVWVASEKGLFKFRDDAPVASFTTAMGLPSDDVKVIHLDRNGALWLGTYGGLVKYENGQFVTLTTANGLASDRVRSIYEDGDGTLWIGTYDGGMSRFKNGSFFNYSIANGLFSNGVFQILENADKNFWISCNRGIYSVNRNNLDALADGSATNINYIAYGRADGISNTEANGGRQPAGIKAADGRFWFPTQDGVVVMNPADVEKNPEPPVVQIEGVTIERQSQDLSKEITLKENSENIEIHFTGITFIKPEQVKFRYRIEGLDQNWTDGGTRRDVYYTFLPAGDYVFHVTAANSDGVWNETGASVKIRVVAPFWRSWWFIGLVIAAVILIAYFMYRRRIKTLQNKALAKETFARQLIESQENERRRIASELHDSLGQSLVLIKNWALLGLKADKDQKPTTANLNEISDTATDAINEVREIAYNLGPYQLERLGLRSTIVEMIQKVSASSAIKFDVEIDEITGELSKEAEVNIFRVVQETVNNVIKHSEATVVSVKMLSGNGRLNYMISDNGEGFILDSPNAKRGFGMLGLAERVNLLKGEISIISDIGKGTTIKVSLPC